MENKEIILIIDDDEKILDLVKEVLENDGYEVETASSGKLGLALVDQKGPDLIILDIVMREMDGYQVLPLLRKRSNAPVIMLTGAEGPRAVSKALDVGADDYVRKPFNIAEFKARIRSKLRRHARNHNKGQN